MHADPGPTFITLFAAIAVGGIFIFPTFKMYSMMGVSAALSLVAIVIWLWTGTGEIPEKDTQAVGRGVTSAALRCPDATRAGWWAMGITMLAIFSAFISLVFGYFFYWTLRENFIPVDAREHASGRSIALVATVGCVGLDRARQAVERRKSRRARSTALLLVGVATAVPRLAALCSRIRTSRSFNPTAGVYAATIWLLAIWSALHLAIGVLMQLYCAARRLAGRMTAQVRHGHRQRRALLALHDA